MSFHLLIKLIKLPLAYKAITVSEHKATETSFQQGVCICCQEPRRLCVRFLIRAGIYSSQRTANVDSLTVIQKKRCRNFNLTDKSFPRIYGNQLAIRIIISTQGYMFSSTEH